VSFPQVFFLPTQRGRRFCVRHRPAGSGVGAIVYVHPFAEEMNKARRMAALQARALAEAGFDVLELDLFGCGDSDGDFGDADWAQWCADVREAAAWLQNESGMRPALWGLRAGCLLACDAARAIDPAPDLLFWQPMMSGKLVVQQFLRVHTAGQLFGDPAASRAGAAQLRAQWERGEAVEIAGYRMAPGLVRGLEAAQCMPPPRPVRTLWLDLAPEAAAEPSPATRGVLERWRGAGNRVDWIPVAGPAFWQSLEITECPELIDATLHALASWRP
jgi:exosortase A-associated hydrolase 2